MTVSREGILVGSRLLVLVRALFRSHKTPVCYLRLASYQIADLAAKTVNERTVRRQNEKKLNGVRLFG